MRVLVVEDGKSMASFIRKALHAEGRAVDVSPDGEEALELVVAAPFDAIVRDIISGPDRETVATVRLSALEK